MTGAFVGLIFGFCAAISDSDPDDTIWLGYQSAGECVVEKDLVGNNTFEISEYKGHGFLWEQLDGGAEIIIDGQSFVIVRFKTA